MSEKQDSLWQTRLRTASVFNRKQRMLRQVYQGDGFLAVLGELTYQMLRPLIKAYTQALWTWYHWCGRFCFPMHAGKLELLREDKGVSIELAVHRSHEPRTSQLLAGALKEGMTVVDVGSNLGYYVLLESRAVGTKGKVVAIEPMQRNAELCKHNIVVNRCSNVVFRQTAVSNVNGVLALHLSEKSNWHTLGPVSQRTIDVPVRACTLDSLVADLRLERVDLVRMDLEGYEVTVLDGMTRTIKQHGPRLLVEIHPQIVGTQQMRHYLGQLKQLGYSPEWVLDQERDVPGRWRFMRPERLSMDELISDWRINIYPRALSVMFIHERDHESDIHPASAPEEQRRPAAISVS